jgi:hypothetical protein
MGFIGTTKVVPFQNRGFDKSFSAAWKVVPRDKTYSCSELPELAILAN